MKRRFRLLDRPAIRLLQPGQRIVEHGIIVERLADGDLRYSVQMRVDGHRVHRVIGLESAGVTRTQAEIFIEQARTKAREGRLTLPRGRKTALGFAAAAGSYLDRLAESGGRNIGRKRTHFALHLIPHFGDQPLCGLSDFAIGRYRKARLADSASHASMNRELSTLSHLLSAAVEWRWISARPCKVKKLPEERGPVTVLSDSECDRLLEAAMADSDTYCWLFVAFGLNTAMRHSEILASRFDRIDFDKLRLHIPDAKAGPREQPITPALAAMLSREGDMARASGSSRRSARSCPRRAIAPGWIGLSPRAVIAAGLDPGG